MRFDDLMKVPLLWLPLCLWVEDFFLLFSRSESFFVDGCLAVSCDFGAFVRGGEVQVLLLHHLISLHSNFCSFNYSVSWCGSPWVHLVWDPLSFLDLDFCFFSNVKEVYNYYLFLQLSHMSLFLFSF